MKKIILTIVLVIASVFLLFGCTTPGVFDQAMEKNDAAMEEKDGDSMMEKDGEAMKKDEGSMIEKDRDSMMEGESMSLSGYQEFSQAAYEKAKAEGKVIFLEFYANWCPSCSKQKPINESTFDSAELPENAVGFQVNYKDSATDADEEALAREFGITYQHTRVILNSDGTVQSKTTGDSSKEQIIANLSAAN